MPLGEALEQHTGVPVYIQHDISAWTMAEALFGASRGARDVIQVVIDHNVGAGVITDGHLLHAGSSSLVEIGHTQVDPYGKRCYCGITAASKPSPVWTVFLSWHSCVSINP